MCNIRVVRGFFPCGSPFRSATELTESSPETTEIPNAMLSSTNATPRPFLARSFTATLLLLILSTGSSMGQVTFAPVTGIGRINVNDMIRTADGNLLLAGPSGLLLRQSEDEPWEGVDFPHEVHSLELLADGTIVAGTSRGIQRSTDGGRSWNLTFNVANVGDFGVKEDGTIMAIDRDPNTEQDGFVYVSTDNGLSWSPDRLNFATLPRTNIVGIGDLFFSGSASGLKLTYNNGEVWETTRLIDSVGSVIVTDNGVLVAASGNATVRTFLWESLDTGRSWTRVDSLHGIRALTPGEGGEYFVSVTGAYGHPGERDEGVWRRTAGAEGRERLFEGDGIVDLLADGDQLLLAANFRLLSGSTSGGDWQEVTGEITEFASGPIAVTPDGAVHAMIPDSIRFHFDMPYTRYRIFRSDDNGLTWTPHYGSVVPESFISDMHGNLYISETSHLWREEEGVYRYVGQSYRTVASRDRGETFSTLFRGSLRKMSAGPTGVIAMMFSDSLRQGFAHDILFSTDRGATWQWLTDEGNPWHGRDDLPTVGALEVAADGAIVAELSGDEESGIYRIAPEEGGLVITGADGTIDPADIVRMDDGRLLATSHLIGSGMYRSADNGVTWQPVSDGQRMQRVTPLGEGTLWGDGRFYSNYYGDSWFTSESAYSIVRGNDGVLYALGVTAGWYRKSLNEGRTWTDPDFRNITAFGRDMEVNSNGHLFISTDDGLFYSVEPASVPGVQSGRDGSEDEIRIELRGEMVYAYGDDLRSTGTTGRLYDPVGRLVAEFPLHPAGNGELKGHLPTSSLHPAPWLLVVSNDRNQASLLFIRQ